MRLKIILALLITIPTQAAIVSRNAGISAVVPTVIDIVVSPAPVSSNLNLIATQTNLVVANISESSNSVAGYKVFAKSVNGLLLKKAAPLASQVSYTFKYAGVSYNLTPANTDVQVKNQNVGNVYQNISSAVSISYTAVNPFSKNAGTYTDSIIFTIVGQ